MASSIDTPAWQPIETAPKGEEVLVYGYNINGQLCPTGPYKYWHVTVGMLGHDGRALDMLHWGGGCCTPERHMDHPTLWMPMPCGPRMSSDVSVIEGVDRA